MMAVVFTANAPPPTEDCNHAGLALYISMYATQNVLVLILLSLARKNTDKRLATHINSAGPSSRHPRRPRQYIEQSDGNMRVDRNKLWHVFSIITVERASLDYCAERRKVFGSYQTLDC